MFIQWSGATQGEWSALGFVYLPGTFSQTCGRIKRSKRVSFRTVRYQFYKATKPRPWFMAQECIHMLHICRNRYRNVKHQILPWWSLQEKNRQKGTKGRYRWVLSFKIPTLKSKDVADGAPNPSTCEAEAEDTQVWGRAGLCGESFSCTLKCVLKSRKDCNLIHCWWEPIRVLPKKTALHNLPNLWMYTPFDTHNY